MAPTPKKKAAEGTRVIRALHEEGSLTVYQAFCPRIADEAVRLGRFGPEFSLGRMSWIKPSFLWMMFRSGWGAKPGQERVLSIELMHEGFIEILEKAVLTSFDPRVYADRDDWKRRLAASEVRCQWDPDKDLHGKDLDLRAIQLGLSGSVLKKYAQEWILKLTDISDDVHKWGEQLGRGALDPAVLPGEQVYAVPTRLSNRLGMF